MRQLIPDKLKHKLDILFLEMFLWLLIAIWEKLPSINVCWLPCLILHPSSCSLCPPHWPFPLYWILGVHVKAFVLAQIFTSPAPSNHSGLALRVTFAWFFLITLTKVRLLPNQSLCFWLILFIVTFIIWMCFSLNNVFYSVIVCPFLR